MYVYNVARLGRCNLVSLPVCVYYRWQKIFQRESLLVVLFFLYAFQEKIVDVLLNGVIIFISFIALIVSTASYVLSVFLFFVIKKLSGYFEENLNLFIKIRRAKDERSSKLVLLFPFFFFPSENIE